MSPVWMPDSKRVLWTSTRGSTTPNLYWQYADGTGTPERLTTHSGNQFPTSVTPDGASVIVFGSNAAQLLDVYRIDLKEDDRKPETLVSSGPMELGGEVSPDGRWLAYHSNESGEYQVYVRPYPDVQVGRYQISTSGGTRAAWSRRGDELFYMDGNGLLFSVKISVGPNGLTPGVPTRLFNTPYYMGGTVLGLALRSYDVAPDGQRFLMIKESERTDARPASASMIVVLNLAAELGERLAQR